MNDISIFRMYLSRWLNQMVLIPHLKNGKPLIPLDYKCPNRPFMLEFFLKLVLQFVGNLFHRSRINLVIPSWNYLRKSEVVFKVQNQIYMAVFLNESLTPFSSNFWDVIFVFTVLFRHLILKRCSSINYTYWLIILSYLTTIF